MKNLCCYRLPLVRVRFFCRTLKADETLSEMTQLRQKKYLNNIIEQEHRPIKRLANAGMGFKSFNTARQTLRGYEAMNMVRKGRSSRS